MQEKNERILEVEPEAEPCRIDKYLCRRLPEYTRSRIQGLIEEKYVLADEVPVKSNYKIKPGQTIRLILPDLKEPDITAEDIPLDIVYEDAEMLVVNKPQGMVVHPAVGNFTGTLVNALLAHCGDSLSGINGEKRPGILHRIDKDTSGLLLVAKTDGAHQSLAAQIKAHSLTRAYQALVHGGFHAQIGTINAPVGRHPTDRKKMTITHEGGREAITHYRVLEAFSRYTLVECVLETGRTHQIRVHMSKNGHPIVGDRTYGVTKEAFALNGQLLHAYKVGFIHPKTGKYMEFTSPLPDYFEKILKILRNL